MPRALRPLPPSDAFSAAKDSVSPGCHCVVSVCPWRLGRLCGAWREGCSRPLTDTGLALCDRRGGRGGLSARLRTSSLSAPCFLFSVTETGRVTVLTPGAGRGTAGLWGHTATPFRWDQLTGLDLSVSERGSRVAVAGGSGRASGGTLTPHGACVQERSSVRFSPGVMRGLGSTTGLGSVLLPWRLPCKQQWLQKGPACEPWFTAWERAQAPRASTCPVGRPPGPIPGPWLSGAHSAGPAALPAAPHLLQTRPGGCTDECPEADA